AILLSLSFVLVSILVYYVLPTFAEFYKGLGGPNTELPALTAGLVGFSNFVRANGVILLLLGAGGFAGFSVWKRTETGRYQFDKFKLGLPLVGNVLRSYAISRFARTLSTLVAGGIPLVTAIEITSGAIANSVFEKALNGVARR